VEAVKKPPRPGGNATVRLRVTDQRRRIGQVSSYFMDVSGVRSIGDVTVESRGEFLTYRVGDVARQVLGGRVWR
jgi:hypothetical protein